MRKAANPEQESFTFVTGVGVPDEKKDTEV
jgi:hypothetical protein